jgi:hypothetical protein
MTDSKQSPTVLDPEWEETLRRGQEAEGENGSVEAELAFVHLLRHTREPEALAPDQLDAIWSAIEAEVAPAGVPWWRKAWVWWSAPALAAAAVLFVVIVKPGDEQAQVARQDSAAHEDKKAEQPPSAAPAPAQIDGARAAEELAKAELAESEPADEKSAEGFAADEGAAGSVANTATGSKRGSGSSAFELNFAKLAPHGRLAIRVGVDQSRDELRSQLLAKARGGER